MPHSPAAVLESALVIDWAIDAALAAVDRAVQQYDDDSRNFDAGYTYVESLERASELEGLEALVAFANEYEPEFKDPLPEGGFDLVEAHSAEFAVLEESAPLVFANFVRLGEALMPYLRARYPLDQLNIDEGTPEEIKRRGADAGDAIVEHRMMAREEMRKLLGPRIGPTVVDNDWNWLALPQGVTGEWRDWSLELPARPKG